MSDSTRFQFSRTHRLLLAVLAGTFIVPPLMNCAGKPKEEGPATEVEGRSQAGADTVDAQGSISAAPEAPNLAPSEHPQEMVADWKAMTDEEWRQTLSPDAYRVLREAGTERAFTGQYWDNKKTGTYVCAACRLPLFSSDTKFKSGTGWPSFWQPLAEENIGRDTDRKLGYERNEVHCSRCGGHLGHVFNDGPPPTGLRYCINSVSLGFEEE